MVPKSEGERKTVQNGKMDIIIPDKDERGSHFSRCVCLCVFARIILVLLSNLVFIDHQCITEGNSHGHFQHDPKTLQVHLE